MYKIRIFDISLTKSGFVLFLSSDEKGPILPVIIGISEAQSITMAINNIEPERPLSHDLFKNILTTFQASVIKIIINDFNNGTFFASIYMSTNDGVQIFDSRPSDAIALAIRYDAPVYVSEQIMHEAGVKAPIEGHDQYTRIDHATLDSEPVSELTVLEKRLQNAVDDEKYEEAAIIRDELNKLKSGD